MGRDSTRVIEEFRGETLVTRELLRAITKRIVEAVDPEKIILFGSYAYGEPTLDSDIDLLVVMKSRQRSIENAMAIDKLFSNRRFAMDIIVRTPQELRHRLALGDIFMTEINQKGRILYDRRDHHRARLGRQSRNGLERRARSRAASKRPAARQGSVRLRAVH
ncbi:MAG: nucleotidyltransferase domain-containing protein [Chloroflexi bacterium]|nr:nucleotidyltransferase domain-containing protein [Chloroflexota bacterium]